MIGLAAGIVINAWLINLIVRIVPLQQAVWISPLVMLVLGLAVQWPWRKEKFLAIRIPVGYLLAFFIVTFIFYRMGRGLGIFDDYLNMPVASIMATGQIPPHFPGDPSMRYDYHYLLLLISAQCMRVGGMYVWSAMDFARAVSVGLAVVLGGMLAYRITHSRLAAFLGSIFVFFDGGARWVLLVLPEQLIEKISDHVHMIGTGGATASGLADALGSSWATFGAGPIPFPFAFVSGINRPVIFAHTATGALAFVIVLLILLLCRRVLDWRSWAVIAVFIAALALVDESLFVLVAVGAFVAWLYSVLKKRSLRLVPTITPWIWTFVSAGLIILLQGGMLSDWAYTHLFLPSSEHASFYSAKLVWTWPPSFVSAHLGSLSLFDPLQLFVALLELGPSVLLYPLMVLYGIRQIRSGHWFEAALIGAGLTSLIFLFINYDGTGGISGSARLYNGLSISGKFLTVPLLWVLARNRGNTFRTTAVGFGLVCILGGIVIFGVQLPAVQKPVYTDFLNDLDAQMAARYWDRLDAGAWVFDPVPERGTSVLGRYTKASVAYYTFDPEWEALVVAPDPYKLRAAGYSYMYFDKRYWDHVDIQYSQLLRSSCVRVVDQIKGERELGKGIADFRRLLDLRDCR